jgi:hypothetical protein
MIREQMIQIPMSSREGMPFFSEGPWDGPMRRGWKKNEELLRKKKGQKKPNL